MDDMDQERIKIESFIKNIKRYYSLIIKCGTSPEEFFGVIRDKNQKLMNVHQDSDSKSDDNDLNNEEEKVMSEPSDQQIQINSLLEKVTNINFIS